MGKLSKAEFSKRLSAVEAEVHLSETEDDINTTCWVDENDNPVPAGVHFRGVNPKAAQKILNDAVAKYITARRTYENLCVRIEAMQTLHGDTVNQEQVLKAARSKLESEGRILTDKELTLLASKEMNRYGSYEAYQDRPREPLPDHIRKKIDEVYGPSKTDTDSLIIEKTPRSEPKQKCILDDYEANRS